MILRRIVKIIDEEIFMNKIAEFKNISREMRQNVWGEIVLAIKNLELF